MTKRRFETTDYKLAHGHAPRGRGSWAFAPADHYPGVIPDDGIAWAYGTYTEAKAEVVRRFPEVDVWDVLT